MKKAKHQYPYNLLQRLGIDVRDCVLYNEFQELFEYELIQADADIDKRNYHMLMMYYRYGCSAAEIGAEYHISRQAVHKRIQKMAERLRHPTRIGRIADLVYAENRKEKCRK